MTQKITAIFGIAVLAAVLLGGLAFSQSAFAGQGGGGGQVKVTLCHVDQETGEEITITVGAPAVPAHLNHGDTLGPCGDEPEPQGTCQECVDELNAEACFDFDCVQSEWLAFADCTLTCTGEAGEDIPDFCFNEEAADLRICIDAAADSLDIDACTEFYTNELVICEAD